MRTSRASVRSILTRTSGFLKTVCSHSLQPYRGCPFGKSLCGVACYVQHNQYLTRGEPWGSFVEVRTNAAEAYRECYERERRWARRSRGGFVIFLSSSTEPFPPLESRERVTSAVLDAMIDHPPDGLIVQTHSHRVVEAGDRLVELAGRCDLRVHVSIETDRDAMPGLPPHASSIERRFAAAAALRDRGLRVVVTVSPLLPLDDPERFFERISRAADAVVLDHYIGGDGSSNGARTLRTALPASMTRIDPASTDLAYRDAMAEVARRWLPGRVSTNIEGFAGRGWG
jgi:DNA repair photolyase